MSERLTEEELKETINLLVRYGDAKFGDEFWPGHAKPHLGAADGERLEALLDRLDHEVQPMSEAANSPMPTPGFNNTQAYAEGWGIFTLDRESVDQDWIDSYGLISLDRLGEGCELGPVVFGEDADDAWRFVVTEALKGSAYHIAAITHLREQAPKEIEHIREKVPEVDRIPS